MLLSALPTLAVIALIWLVSRFKQRKRPKQTQAPQREAASLADATPPIDTRTFNADLERRVALLQKMFDAQHTLIEAESNVTKELVNAFGQLEQKLIEIQHSTGQTLLGIADNMEKRDQTTTGLFDAVKEEIKSLTQAISYTQAQIREIKTKNAT